MVGATTKTEILLRNREVAVNRGIVKRFGIRGHRIDDSEANKGNFLESLRNRFEKNQPLHARSIYVICSKPFSTACEEFQNRT